MVLVDSLRGGVVVDGDDAHAVAHGLPGQRVVQVDAYLLFVEVENRARQGFAVLGGKLDDQAGLELELPASSSTAQREPKEITVLLAADGTLSYDGDELDSDQLRQRLQAAIDSTERKMVVLRADTSTSHGEVVKIMDLIREAGAEGLTVAARSGE